MQVETFLYKRVPPSVSICLMVFLANNHEFGSLKRLKSKNLKDNLCRKKCKEKSVYNWKINAWMSTKLNIIFNCNKLWIKIINKSITMLWNNSCNSKYLKEMVCRFIYISLKLVSLYNSGTLSSIGISIKNWRSLNLYKNLVYILLHW